MLNFLCQSRVQFTAWNCLDFSELPMAAFSGLIVIMLTLLLPDRLPSLIVLVGFWIPPAIAGWVAAELLRRSTKRYRVAVTLTFLAIFVLGYAAVWFLFNLGRMPPYIPGASTDPTFAPPEAVNGLAVFTTALVLPGSALACALAFRGYGWMHKLGSTELT